MKNLRVLFSLVALVIFTLVVSCRKDESPEKGDWGFTVDVNKESTNLGTLKVNEERSIVLDLKSDNYNFSSLPLKFKVSSNREGEFLLKKGYYLRDSLRTSQDTLKYIQRGFDVSNPNAFVDLTEKIKVDTLYNFDSNIFKNQKINILYIGKEEKEHKLDFSFVNEKGVKIDKDIVFSYSGWKKVGTEEFRAKVVSDKSFTIFANKKHSFKLKLFLNIPEHFPEVDYYISFKGVSVSYGDEENFIPEGTPIKIPLSERSSPEKIKSFIHTFVARVSNPNVQEITVDCYNSTNYKVNSSDYYDVSFNTKTGEKKYENSSFPLIIKPIGISLLGTFGRFFIYDVEVKSDCALCSTRIYPYFKNEQYITLGGLSGGEDSYNKHILENLKIKIWGFNECTGFMSESPLYENSYANLYLPRNTKLFHEYDYGWKGNEEAWDKESICQSSKPFYVRKFYVELLLKDEKIYSFFYINNNNSFSNYHGEGSVPTETNTFPVNIDYFHQNKFIEQKFYPENYIFDF